MVAALLYGIGMALFDFEITNSGCCHQIMDPQVEPPVYVEARFQNLFGESGVCSFDLNGHIMQSGFQEIKVGGTMLAGPDIKVGTVLAHDALNKQVTVDSNGDLFQCSFAPVEAESFGIGDPVVIFEHFEHHKGHFGEIIWFVTKKTLINPGVVSIALDILGAGGSGIGRMNVDPYTGAVHYGSGLESKSW